MKQDAACGLTGGALTAGAAVVAGDDEPYHRFALPLVE
jgi:hypothetical protein